MTQRVEGCATITLLLKRDREFLSIRLVITKLLQDQFLFIKRILPTSIPE